MKVLEIPREVLYAAILVFAVLGTYAISNSVAEVLIMGLVGVVGFFMRRYDFPIAPVILGVILGPLMEAQYRRTLIVSDGDFTAFVERPISIAFLLVALAMLVLPRLVPMLRRRREPAT